MTRGGFASLALLLLVLGAARAAAQAPIVRDLTLDDEAVIEETRATDRALERGEFDVALPRLQRLLERGDEAATGDEAAPFTHRFALVPVDGRDDLTVSLDTWARRRVLALPDEALARYRALFARTADELAETPGGAIAVRRRHPFSDAGLAAARAAAHDHVEAGRGADALAAIAQLELGATRGLGRSGAAERAALRALAYHAADDRSRLRALAAAPEAEAPVTIAGARSTVRELAAGLPGLGGAPAALDLPRAEVRWTLALEADAPDRPAPRPRAVGDLVVFHTRREVLAVERATGRPRWRRAFPTEDEDEADLPPPSLGANLRSLAGAAGEGLYVFAARASAGATELVALDLASGETRWRRTAPIAGVELTFDSGPTIGEGRVWATAHDDAALPSTWILCFRARDGALQWADRLRSGLPLRYRSAEDDGLDARGWITCSTPALCDGALFVADNRGHVAVLDAASGRARFVLRYERRRPDDRLGGRGAIARGWSDSPALADGGRCVVAPEDADGLFALLPAPATDAAAVRAGEILVRLATLPRDGMSRLVSHRDGVVTVAGRDTALDTEVLRAFTPFAGAPRLAPWPAPAPLEDPLAGICAEAPGILYLPTTRGVYRIDHRTGHTGQPTYARREAGGAPLGLVATSEGLIAASAGELSLLGPKRP
ncbi:MAG: PQQ-binding-like beta-propeller repeat protein [Planctomycetota bacterium]